MFHHFHDENHPPSQGSISSVEFEEMIDWLQARRTILSPDEYLRRLGRGQLKNSDICLSFDDALLCQFEVAIPVLKRRGLQAFFFVYSSLFDGDPDPLEIYRYFRTTYFSSIDDFYEIFFGRIERLLGNRFRLSMSEYQKLNYLNGFSFYTSNDKWFRFLRDQVLTKSEYSSVMNLIMESYNFNVGDICNKLWMCSENLKELDGDGHMIGLHSYSHPTTMHRLLLEEQRTEYFKNYQHLSSVIGKPITSMAHPCGNYNDDTLKVLDELGIEIGFLSNCNVNKIKSKFEIPREDHANILKEMAK